jgi:16S rRNA C1402 (ribose-2'-O) methylase RsmI
LSEKFLEHSDEDVCQEVNNKLQEYMDAMSDLCEEEASVIMCKSLTNMFKVWVLSREKLLYEESIEYKFKNT